MVKLQDLIITWTNINTNQMLGLENNLWISYRRDIISTSQAQELKSKRVNAPAPGHRGMKSRNSKEHLFQVKYTTKFIITGETSSL